MAMQSGAAKTSAAQTAKTVPPQTKTTEAKKRGDGPVSILYMGSENTESKRVPADVQRIVVKPKNGSPKSYSLRELPPATLHQLAAYAVAKRMDIFVRNSADDDGKVNVIDCTDDVWSQLSEGKLYSRGIGKASVGRVFDIDMWVNIMEEAAKMKKKPATEAQLKAFRTKLESKQGKERSQFLLKLTKDPQVALAKAKIKSLSNDGEYNALSDAF